MAPYELQRKDIIRHGWPEQGTEFIEDFMETSVVTSTGNLRTLNITVLQLDAMRAYCRELPRQPTGKP